MELMISPASPPTQDFRFHSAATSPYATAPSSPHRLGLAGAGANPLASADGMAGGPFLGSTATAPSSPDQFELLPPATPRLTGANPFDLFQHFTSAPASPGRAAAMYAHFTEGNNGLDGSDDEEGEDDFRPRASYSTAASAVPFDWEEKPGTPKAGFAGDTTNGAEEEDFEFGTHFDKSAPPPKLTTADELFVKGKIRPLKPPPGLLDGGSVGSSPRSPMTKAPMWSPRRRSRVGSGLDFDPFTAALLETTKSPSPLGGKDAATNTRSGPLTQKPDTKSGWRRKWRLSDLLLFRSSSEGRVNKDPIFKCSPAHPPAEPVKKIMSPEPTMAKGKGNSMGKPKKLGKKDGMAAAEDGTLLHQPHTSLSHCSLRRPISSRAPRAPIQLPIPYSSVSAGSARSRGNMSFRCPYFAAGEKTVAGDSPAAALRRILQSPGVHQAPCCFDALSARLIELAGFPICFMGGFAVSAARLGLPDVGLMSYGEIIDQGRQITEAVSIPVIGDADNGYGNSMNVKRTVKGFINAGFAGIMLEDQVSPKACGHTQGRKVISREEAIMHLKAAIDARKESGSDIVIVARTDSRQAISLDEALWRVRAFADVGVDALFIDALASKEEMKAFCEISPGIPKMANMLEGGGKTPILSPVELEEIGYKFVAYPLSLIGVSMRAMEDALIAIKGGRIPPPASLPSFEEIKDTLGFNRYYKEEKPYIIPQAQPSYSSGEACGQGDTKSRDAKPQEPVIDILPKPYDTGSSGAGTSTEMWSRTLSLKITGRDGTQKIDARIPAGFLEGMSKILPGLAGVNIMERLQDAPIDAENPQNGKVLLDFMDTAGDRIQVFI